MYGLIIFIHVVVVIILIAVILVQRGRSSGLIEALGGVESIFGTKTSSFFVKVTVFLAVLFFLTSITLDYLSKQRRVSVVEKITHVESVPSEGETSEDKTNRQQEVGEEESKPSSVDKDTSVPQNNLPETSK